MKKKTVHHKKANRKSNLHKHGLLFLALVIVVAILVVLRLTSEEAPKTHAQIAPIVVDHNSVALFDQIPEEYITAARNMRLLFIDRSVGQNIHDGLNCISSGATYLSAPNSCKTGLTPATYTSDTKYNRANWEFAHYGEGGWWDNVSNFILNRNMQNSSRVAWAPDYSTYQVFNFMFSYLDVAQGSNITSPTSGYFISGPGTSAIRDINDMRAFEAGYPGKTFVLSTTSLARSIGTQVSTDFNARVRQEAAATGKVLFDMADIESHNPAGDPCYDNLNDGINHEAICAVYTTEANGGHLSYGLGKQRVAKAFWVMMAQIAGWVPDGSLTPTSGGPTNTPTNSPTAGPTSTPTDIPTPTNTPGPTSSPTPVPTSGPFDPNYYLNFDDETTLGGDCTTCTRYNTTLVSDEYHNAYDFNGTNSYMDLGNIAYIKSWPTFSYNVWIKPAFAPGEATNRYVFTQGSEMSLFYLSAIQDFRATVRTPAGTIRVDTQNLSWTTNTWHMVTVVYNGTSVKLYWDGLLKASTAGSGTVATSTQAARVGTAPVLGSYYRGLIDEMSIFSTVLSDADIVNLFNLGR